MTYLKDGNFEVQSSRRPKLTYTRDSVKNKTDKVS